MKNNCLFFYLIYPELDKKQEYLKRYEDRGSPESFLKILNKNWNGWIEECWYERYGCENIEMSFEFLNEELINLIDEEEN